MKDQPLIVNPFATRVSEEQVRALETKLDTVETLLTERTGHAIELARAAKGDAVFVYGGDGLVNEALNGLPEGKPLGIVAGGHTNVLARAAGVPSDPARAVHERRISLGRVNGRRFGFSAGIGVDSEAVRELETMRRAGDGKRRGDLAYAQVVTRRLARGLRAQVRDRGPRPCRDDLRLERRRVHVRGAAAVPLLPRRALRTGARLRRPRAGRRGLGAPLRRAPVRRPGARRPARRPARPRRRRHSRGLCDRPLPLEADGEDLGDVGEAVFEAERDAVSILV